MNPCVLKWVCFPADLLHSHERAIFHLTLIVLACFCSFLIHRSVKWSEGVNGGEWWKREKDPERKTEVKGTGD